MQLYACDQKNQLIFAGNASKQFDYYCLECRQLVRRRSGLHRRAHFYHLALSSACRLNQKTLAHLQVQWKLQQLLPSGECHLEHRFPDINRIADVYWDAKGIVFEIQCSPISALEIKSRNEDYAKKGIQVVWILHDERYNKKRLTEAELFLRSSPFYFTNIDANGKGIIYDQFDTIQNGYRELRSPSLAIDPTTPMPTSSLMKQKAEWPFLLVLRTKEWKTFFPGDLMDICLNSADLPAFLKQAREEELKTELPFYKNIINHLIIRPYNLLFQIILEKACK